jgi:2OG-Fe(II) oxygenase superfamily
MNAAHWSDVGGPVLQLTRDGAEWRAGEDAVSDLRRDFTRRHCVRLPALIEPVLLARLQAEIARTAFHEREHPGIARELCMEQPGTCAGMLHFAVNDDRMFRLVEDVSGCRPIRRFSGRVYRRHAGGAHYDSWHNDVLGQRQIGMSVNLSTEVYEGGVFEIRDTGSLTTLGSIANIGFGDAILFRIAPALEHRVSEVRGTAAKTALAGWFGS